MRRPIDKKLKKRSKLPSVKKLWSVEEKLGGWDKAQTKFFSANVRQSLAAEHSCVWPCRQSAGLLTAATHPHASNAALQHAASCTSVTPR